MNITELRKASVAVFLATEAPVAQDLSDKLRWAADKIDRLQAEKIGEANPYLLRGDELARTEEARKRGEPF